MLHVDFKKGSCRPVKFLGQGPFSSLLVMAGGDQLQHIQGQQQWNYKITSKMTVQQIGDKIVGNCQEGISIIVIGLPI